MARILLCNPVFLEQLDPVEATSPYFPLGLLYLAAYIRDHGHEVAIYDGTFDQGAESFRAHAGLVWADIVGISAVLPSREDALALAAIAHERGKRVIIGGPDATQWPEVYLSYSQVDLVVHHEGEQTIVALLDCIQQQTLQLEDVRELAGIALREQGQVRVNVTRPPIQDLDSLPLPARDLIDMNRYLEHWKDLNGYASLTISTARGCPYGCEWCRDAVHGPEFRQRSPEHVAAEVAALKAQYGIDRLRVVDDVDGISRDWVEAWAQSAAERDAVVPFEGLNELQRQDLPMLDIRDSL